MAAQVERSWLRIGLFVEGTLLDEALVEPDSVVTIGDRIARNTFVVPGSGLPDSVRVFAPSARGTSGLALCLGPHVRAQLERDGRIERHAIDEPAMLLLAPGDRGRVHVGEATLLFQLVRAPAPEPAAPWPRAFRGGWLRALGALLVTSMLCSTIAHVTPVAILVNMDFPEPLGLEAMESPHAKFVYLGTDTRVDEPPTRPPEEIDVIPDDLLEDPGAVAVRERPDERPRIGEPEPDPEPEPRRVDERRRMREEVERTTILRQLGALSSRGEGGIVDALGRNQDTRTIEEAFADATSLTMNPSAELSRPNPNHPRTEMPGLFSIGGLSGPIDTSGYEGTGAKKRRRRVTVQPPPGKRPDHTCVMCRGSNNAFKEALRRLARRLKYCYERSLESDGPGLSGKMVLRMEVAGNGRVQDASLIADSVGGSVGRCALRVAKRMRFPSTAHDAPVVLNQSFIFETAD